MCPVSGKKTLSGFEIATSRPASSSDLLRRRHPSNDTGAAHPSVGQTSSVEPLRREDDAPRVHGPPPEDALADRVELGVGVHRVVVEQDEPVDRR